MNRGQEEGGVVVSSHSLELAMQAGRVAEQRGWADVTVVAADELLGLDPGGPSIVAVAEQPLTVEQARVIAGLTGAGRAVAVVSNHPIPSEAQAWLPPGVLPDMDPSQATRGQEVDSQPDESTPHEVPVEAIPEPDLAMFPPLVGTPLGELVVAAAARQDVALHFPPQEPRVGLSPWTTHAQHKFAIWVFAHPDPHPVPRVLVATTLGFDPDPSWAAGAGEDPPMAVYLYALMDHAEKQSFADPLAQAMAREGGGDVDSFRSFVSMSTFTFLSEPPWPDAERLRSSMFVALGPRRVAVRRPDDTNWRPDLSPRLAVWVGYEQSVVDGELFLRPAMEHLVTTVELAMADPVISRNMALNSYASLAKESGAAAPSAPGAAGQAAEQDLRLWATAEALQRDPSLGEQQDPASLQRLREAVDQVIAEKRTLDDLEAAKARKQTELATQAAAREAAERDRQAQERKARATAAREREAQAERDRLAAMNPVTRLIKTHPLFIGSLVGSVLLIALVLWVSAEGDRQRERDAQEAAAAEAEAEAAEEERCSNFRPAADLSGCRITNAKLEGTSLARVDLSRAYIHGDLEGADLSGANLRGAELNQTNLKGADLSRANLRGAALSGVTLNGASLKAADLTGADLPSIALRNADLSGANLSDSNVDEANFRGADLSGTKWKGARAPSQTNIVTFAEADLRGADFTGAKSGIGYSLQYPFGWHAQWRFNYWGEDTKYSPPVKFDSTTVWPAKFDRKCLIPTMYTAGFC